MSDFTTAQQANIRQVLGYPSLNRYKNTRLEGIIAGTNVLDSDTIALVVAALANIAAVDAKIGSTGLSAAGVKGVGRGAVELYEGRQLKDWRSIGRQYITQISNLLGVPLYGDYYGQNGYPGDSYSSEGLGRSPTGGGSRGGGMIPLG